LVYTHGVLIWFGKITPFGLLLYISIVITKSSFIVMSPHRFLFAFLFILCISGLFGQKATPEVLESHEPQACLICFDHARIASTDHFKTKIQKGRFVYAFLKDQLEKSASGTEAFLKSKGIPYKKLLTLQCLAVDLTGAQAQEISRLPNVRRIQIDPIMEMVRPEEDRTIDLRDPMYTWGIEMIRADLVQEMGIKGLDVVIGGNDTGVGWDVESLVNTYRGNGPGGLDHNYNWHDAIHEISPLHGDSIILPTNNPCGLDTNAPCDDHGHGTHTLGTALGQIGDDVFGVAPEAEWVACRCMERGYGSLSTYTECFDFFLAPTDTAGENANPDMAPHVIVNSWKCPEMEGCNLSNWAVMETAVNNLRAAGVVVVVSAGNDGGRGCSSLNAPAAIFGGAFTVGATAGNDSIAGFSSRGPVMSDSSGRIKPDIAAPGVAVRSQIHTGAFQTWNGTSMAGPHVAGVVALMISANPQLAGKVSIIEDIIKRTAVTKYQDELGCDTITMQVPNNIYGWGRIDAYEAVQEAIRYVSTGSDEDDPAKVWLMSPNPDGLTGYTDIKVVRAEVITTSGKKISLEAGSFEGGAFSINLNLPRGIYTLVLTDDRGQRHTAKWIRS
jgi:subtilisin family serine protease